MLPIFELAYSLHMPVYKLLEEMPYQEFALWMQYFEKRPIGWREDERTFKQLAAAGVKAKPEALFNSLALMKQNNQPKSDKPLPQKGSLLHTMLMSAKGGDKLQFLENL